MLDFVTFLLCLISLQNETESFDVSKFKEANLQKNQASEEVRHIFILLFFLYLNPGLPR